MIQIISLEEQKGRFSHYPVYHGDDLGLSYSSSKSAFRIWAPTADEVQLLLYTEGCGGDECYSLMMHSDECGTWVASLPGDWKGKFYVFRALINNVWMEEVPDPYARIVGVNGKRAMIGDLRDTDPQGWENDKSPYFAARTDAVIYELHIRDISIAANSGIVQKGKYIGLIEQGTTCDGGLTTGLDHLKELGITHVHFLPFYDFNSLDESALNSSQYNWGYDPLNYNAPEGSYSSDPFDGMVRIRELKEMIKTLHEQGLRVIMDVSFNHTADAFNSSFNQLVPEYYYRQTEEGELSDATACGNETASERGMMRKFILDSALYWLSEFHVDGFRFDLMGVHDITTMNLVSRELHKTKPDILLYGEGWAPGKSPLAASMRAIKTNVSSLNRIAVYGDDLRDAIRGNIFKPEEKGFVSGRPGMEDVIKFGVTACCPHPQVNYSKLLHTRMAYASYPHQSVSYCDSHDNHILWDRLAISAPDASEEQRKEMQKLALSILLTSQGIPFLHAGSEFLRTKKRVENSYKSSDEINGIDWSQKVRNRDVFEYIKALVRIRKEHPAFRMRTAEQIQANIRFEEHLPDGVVGYLIDGAAMRDEWRRIRVYYNGGHTIQKLFLEVKNWKLAVRNNRIAAGEVIRDYILLQPFSCNILYLEIPRQSSN
jgi:pullulanase